MWNRYACTADWCPTYQCLQVNDSNLMPLSVSGQYGRRAASPLSAVRCPRLFLQESAGLVLFLPVCFCREGGDCLVSFAPLAVQTTTIIHMFEGTARWKGFQYGLGCGWRTCPDTGCPSHWGGCVYWSPGLVVG